MEVNLSPDLEARHTRIASQRGCDAEAVARDAIERVVNFDEWLIEEVDKGLAQIERGEVLTHELKGNATVRLVTGSTRQAEIHWYEAHGVGRKGLKIKRFLD